MTPTKDNEKFITIDGLVNKISEKINCRKDSFVINDNMVECYLGGIFIPSCGEMRSFSAINWDEDGEKIQYNLGDAVVIKQSEIFQYTNSATRCYYEFIKRNTNINYIYAKIKAAGIIEVTIMAQDSNIDKIVQQKTINFGANATEVNLPLIDIVNLPVNGSLYISIRGIGTNSIFHSFSWIGKAQLSRSNFGERIYLIRTFGCKPAVVNTINVVADKIAQIHPRILERSIFVIYDATGDENSANYEDISKLARIIEFTGPNCGGGGNASLLLSIVLRIDEAIAKNISEIILMDDDAKIDAETIIRHDGYVTARKSNIISTAIVYKSNSPTVIQEYGGIWGKFFSKINHGVRVNPEATVRTMFPYLPRSNRDTQNEFDCKYIGTMQPVDYATFIFISFPYRFIRKVGAPFPFFLRNDDVEICLRCAANGGQVAVNPNIHAWHITRQTVVSEFYSFLHGLIVNNAYDWLSEEYLYITLMDRISRLVKVGNCVLLYAYMLALEKFAEGHDWMSRNTIFDEYIDISKSIKKFIEKCVYIVPLEVVDVNKDYVQIINIVDNCPEVPTKDKIVFIDKNTSLYYCQDVKGCDPSINKMLKKCINYINKITENFDILSETWKSFLMNFDHITFWDKIFADKKFELQLERLEYSINDKISDKSMGLTGVYNIAQMNEIKKIKFPPGFTEEGYLSKNPDVANSGMSPKQHWLKYGRNEGREY